MKRKREWILFGVLGLLLIALSSAQETPSNLPSLLSQHEFTLGSTIHFDYSFLNNVSNADFSSLNSSLPNSSLRNSSLMVILYEKNIENAIAAIGNQTNGNASTGNASLAPVINETAYNGTAIDAFLPTRTGKYHVLLDINASLNGSGSPTPSHNDTFAAVEAVDSFFVTGIPATAPTVSTDKNEYALGETVIIRLNYSRQDYALYLSSSDALYQLLGEGTEINYTPSQEGHYTLYLKQNENIALSSSFVVTSPALPSSELIFLNATEISVGDPLLIIPLEMVTLTISGAGKEFQYGNLSYPMVFTPQKEGTYSVMAMGANSTQQRFFTALAGTSLGVRTFFLNETVVLDVDITSLIKGKRTLFNVIFRTSPLDSATFFVQRHSNDFRFNLSAERLSDYQFRITILPHQDIMEETYVLETQAIINGKQESYLTPFAWLSPPFTSLAPPPETRMDIIRKYTSLVFPITQAAIFDIDLTTNISAQRDVLELALKQPKVEQFTVFVKGHQDDQRFQLSLEHIAFDRFEVTIPPNPSIEPGVYRLAIAAAYGGKTFYEERLFSWGVFDAATFLQLLSQSETSLPQKAKDRTPLISAGAIDFGDFTLGKKVKDQSNAAIEHNLTAFTVKGENTSTIVADMTLAFSGKGIKEVKFSNAALQKNKSFELGFADLDGILGPKGFRTEKAYAIDPTAMEFSNATITSIAKGKSLYKCRQWNFSTQTCYGSWEKLMDLTLGQEYSFTLTPEDPGYAEVGLASINTNKSTYHLGEAARLYMVVLDIQGFLVQGAQVTLNITSPFGATTLFSTDNFTILETSKGIYEAHFSNISEEGNYTLLVQAIGSGVNNTMLSHFTVKQEYAFDILRKTPITIDPFEGPFESSILIVSLGGAEAFNLTETLPANFTIVDSPGAIVVSSENGTTLTWNSLSNNSVVSYTAQAPLITPELWEIGPATIRHTGALFIEAKPWFLAIDPDAFPGGSIQLRPQDCSSQSSSAAPLTFSSSCDGTYPSTCAGTDYIGCDDTNIETHTAARGGAPPVPLWGGIKSTFYNSSVDDCTSITSVLVCYKVWITTDAGYTCNVSIDNDEDNTFVNSTAFACETSEPTAVTCTNVTTGEDWSCSDFFGSLGTRAQAIAQATDYAGGSNSDPINIDALYFNVSYTLDTSPPRLNISINNTSPYLGNVINISANVSDNVAVSYCQFIHNQSGPLGIRYLNQSVSGSNVQCSQNFTIYALPYSVVNFTVRVNDTKNNVNQSFVIITIADGPPTVAISLNRTGGIVYLGDTINITGTATDDFLLSSGQVLVNDTGFTRIFNFSLGGTSAQFSQNITLNCPVGCVINFTVRANDSIAYSSQDTILGIMSELPPNLSAPECSINAGSFESCRNLAYIERLDTIRARCNSTSGSTVHNVSFLLTNLEDNRVYINQTITTTADTYWQYSTGGINISDSGSFSIYTVCQENVVVTNHTNWTIPWGSLVSTLITPTVAVNVTQYVFFNFTAQVECVGGECGSVNATLDPQSASSASPVGNDANQENELSSSPTTQTTFSQRLPPQTQNADYTKHATEDVAGVLIINPSQSIYSPFSVATLHAVLLDRYGKPYGKAQITGSITAPSGKELPLPEFRYAYPRYSTTYLLPEEGFYTVSIASMLEGTELQSQTKLLAAWNPPFHFMREQQDVLDPWKELFSSKIIIQPRSLQTYSQPYSAYESLPLEFGITSSTATNIRYTDSRLILAWENLSGVSTIEYEATLPQLTPIAYHLDPLTITYGKENKFSEPTSFFVAADPAGSVNLSFPDAAAPGMSVAVQFVGDDFDDTDSITLNTTDIFVGPKRITNTSGNPVENNGRVMTVPFFISEDAEDQVVGIWIAGTQIARPFKIVTPSSRSGNFSGASGMAYLGDGKNGTRTFGGTIVLDSLIIPAGVTVTLNITDPDGISSNGHQGYLPVFLIVDGPINISGTLNVSGVGGGVGSGDVGGEGGAGGPGGAGGGAGGGDQAVQNNGGDGFTGGGGGSCEGDDASCVEGNGGAGTGSAGAFGSSTTDTGGAGGKSISPFVSGGGNSTGSTGNGAGGDGAGGGGGTGFFFGSSGTGGNGVTPTEGSGGSGGGGGSVDANGGGAGFGTAGTTGTATGGSVHSSAQLIPLSGGSGGGGAGAGNTNGGGGGGGGGGILLFSNEVIAVPGSILAVGGHGGIGGDGSGGAGSGGSIILQSPTISLTGILNTSEGTSAGGGDGGLGRVRVDGIGTSAIPGSSGSKFNASVITNVTITHVSGRGAPGAILELIVQTPTTSSSFNGTVEQDGTFSVPVAYTKLGMNYITLIQNTSLGSASVMSSASLAMYDVHKGVIPMYSGIPFYTISLNPSDFNNNSCLFNMSGGKTCQTSWLVNATGTSGSTWEFFVTHSSINYSGYVTDNDTRKINITILSNQPPSVSSVSLEPIPIAANYSTLNCSFTVTDPNSFDDLSAQVLWYRNDALNFTQIIGASNAQMVNATLTSNYTQVGDFWKCGVVPLDEVTSGSQSNSSQTEIYKNFPPTLNSVQCQINNSAWGSCNQLSFSDVLTSVRVNCTSIISLNATINFSNYDDRKTFFYNTTTTQLGDYLLLNNSDMPINDSGDFLINATCADSDGISRYSNITWAVPYGTLSASLVEPAGDTNVERNQVFTFTSLITCRGGECGTLNASVIYNTTSTTWAYVNTTTGDMPFFTKDMNPKTYLNQSCLANLTAPNTCTAIWNINASGSLNSQWRVFSEFNATTYLLNVSGSQTSTIVLTITDSSLVPPIVALNAPSDAALTNNATVLFNCSVTDNIGLKNISLYANFSGTFRFNGSSDVTGTANSSNFTRTIVPDGIYVWNCRAYDTNDNEDWGNSNRTITIDSTRPGINLTNPPNGSNLFSGTVQFDFNATDNLDATLSCNLSIDGSVAQSGIPATNGANTSATINGLAQGTHYWNVTCIDDALNANTSETRYFSIVDIPPVANLTTLNNSIFNSPNITFSYNASDNNDVVIAEFWINGALNQTDTSVTDNEINTFLATNMSEGRHNWTINVSDVSGLSFMTEWRYFIVDLSPGHINLTGPPNATTINVSTFDFNFTVIDRFSPTFTCNLTMNGSILDSNFNANNGSVTTRTLLSLQDGWRLWNVSCKDYVNNTNTSLSYFINISVPPTLSLGSPSDGHATQSQNLNFTYTPIDNTAFSKCEFIINGQINFTNTTVSNGAINNFSLQNIAPGKYNWTVNCSDTIGLTATAPVRNFTVDIQRPNVTLFMPLASEIIGNPNVRFNFTATDDLDTTLTCNLSINNLVNVSNIAALNGSYTNVTVYISDETTYTWNVTCIDDALNFNSSETRSFSTVLPPEVFLLTPGDGTIFSNGTMLNLTYVVFDNQGLNNASLMINGALNQTVDSPPTDETLYFLLNITQDGVYYWNINASDTNELYASGTRRNFTVDTTDPVVTNYTPQSSVTLSSNNVSFNFSVTDNLDSVLECNLTIDSTVQFQLNLSNGSSIRQYYLLADGAHTWFATCIDHANNTNITPITPFTVEAPPNVTLVSVANNTRTYIPNTTFTYLPQDPLGIYNCTLYVNSIENETNTAPTANAQNNFFYNSTGHGQYNWTVTCHDAAPDFNPFTPTNFTWFVDLLGPYITLNAPTDGQNFNDDDITFNFTPLDHFGFATPLLCNLTLDGLVNVSNISVVSGLDNVTTIMNLATGPHSYNVTCKDDFNNTNTSPTITFIVNSPDLAINNTDIFFNNTHPLVNDSIRVNATFYNIGGIPANNFNVLFYDNGALFGNYSISSLPQAQNTSAAATFNATLGFHSIFVDISYDEVELRVDNNNATGNLSTLIAYTLLPVNGSSTNSVSTTVNFTLQDYAHSMLNYTLYLDGIFNRTSNISDNQSLGAEFNLSEGVHTVIVQATGPRIDVLGKNANLSRLRNSTELTITVDFTVPLPSFETYNSTWFSDQTPEIHFNITDNLDSVINFTLYINYVKNISNSTLNGTHDALNLSFLDDGEYNLTLEAFDDAGNRRNSSNLTIYMDTGPPNATIITANLSNFSNNRPLIRFNLTDVMAPLINYTLYVDFAPDIRGNATNGINKTENISIVPDGYHTVLVEAMDRAGNKFNSTFINITIDTTPPFITIDYPSENQPLGYYIQLLTTITDALMEVDNVTYTISNDSLYYFKNGTLNATTSFDDAWNSTADISEDVEFMYINFSVTANDTLGNTRTTVRRFIVDNKRPSIQFVAPNEQDYNSNFSLDVRIVNRNLTQSTFNITNISGSLITNRSNFSISSAFYNWTTLINLSPDPLFLEGWYNLTVFAADDVGNNKTSSTFFRVDRTYPNTTSVYPPNYFNTTSTTLELNFTVLDNFDKYPLCNISLDGSIAVQNINATNGSITNVTMASLGEGFHYWNATCEDNAGNYNTSLTRNFTIDQTAPTILLGAPQNNSFNYSTTIAFYYLPRDNYTSVMNCSLVLDGQLNQTNLTIAAGSENFFNITTLEEKRYRWDVNCTDTVGNTGTNGTLRYVVIDRTPPNASFATNNGTWFNTATPPIFFNITDNFDTLINYTFYADSILNTIFHIANGTLGSATLSSLQNGTHLILIESYDDAYNLINSTNLTIIIDTAPPNVTLLGIFNNTNSSQQNITFFFNATDNLDIELLCNLTVDGVVNISSIPASNGANTSRYIEYFGFGSHNWSVTCQDNATNTFTSATWYFNITPPDLEVSSIDIVFNDTEFEEFLNFTIFVNVTNIGLGTAYNALVQLFSGDPDNGGTQLNGNFYLNLTPGQNKTINLSWGFGIGSTDIFVQVDRPDAIIETDNSNNKANRSINISAYNVVFGNITGSRVIQSVANQTLFSWQVSNSTAGNIFVIDSDSSIAWSNITALGINVTDGNVTTDFADLDLALNMTNLTDSLNRTYTAGGRPKDIQDFTIFAHFINTTAIVNSTNNSALVTGILWDKSDSNPGEFNGTQDVIFATEIRRNTLSRYGVYDFEIKVPARLRQYRQPNAQNSVTFYAELK